MPRFGSNEDRTIIDGLKAGGELRLAAEKQLNDRYLYFIDKVASKYQIAKEDATESYQNAIKTVVEGVSDDSFNKKLSLKRLIYRTFFKNCQIIPSEDKKIIDGLKKEGKEYRLAEHDLFERFKYFIDEVVSNHKITKEDATSGYNDSFLVVVKNIVDGTYKVEAPLKTYFRRIFINKCVDIIRKNKNNSIDKTPEDLENLLPDDIKKDLSPLVERYESRLYRALEQLEPKSLKLLVYYYFEGHKDKDIATSMNYNTPKVVKTTRHRCLEKLRNIIGNINDE